MRRVAMLLACVGLFFVSVPMLAHHSFTAQFDNTAPVLMKGKFTGMDWVNPHSWVHFDVEYPDGEVINWGAETPPPNVLYRNGWRRDHLKPGDEIQIRGFAAKDGSPTMWASEVTIVATGERIFGLNQRAPGQ